MAKAIILGASSGIGNEMALRLAGEKWQVGITGRRGKLLDEVAMVFPDSIIPIVLDVNDVATLGGILNALASLLGGVDLLVISAGCGYLNAELALESEFRTEKPMSKRLRLRRHGHSRI